MNKPLEWVAGVEFKKVRLDAALAKKFPEISRCTLKEMIQNGEILVNQLKVKPSLKLSGKENIQISLREKSKPEIISPTLLTFDILFEDSDVIVIDKPKGMVVHPGAGREAITVVSCVLGHTTLSPVGAPVRPGIIQRLDKETSGVMVLAKTRKAHLRLAKAFSGKKVNKEYLAIAQGAISEQKGRIEVALLRDRINRKRMRATRAEHGRMAISQFEVIENFTGATLIRVRILTGRTHQIRVHLAYIGHPLLGDVLYGGTPLKGKPTHFLHSSTLQFFHPITNVQMKFESSLPNDFVDMLRTFNCRSLEALTG